ncbi:MAG: glycine--tRNA ligase [Bacteroidota bacterium]
MDKLVSLCKRRGFIFQSSEIYGGLNGCWDYGPLGVELLNNIKQAWWQAMTYREDIEGIDASILMHPKVWEASGHVENFTDPMVDCQKCKARFRLDTLSESLSKKQVKSLTEAVRQLIDGLEVDSRVFHDYSDDVLIEELRAGHTNWRQEKQPPERFKEHLMKELLDPGWVERNLPWFFSQPDIGKVSLQIISCPQCGNKGAFTPARNFNLMFKTFIGPLEDSGAVVYLRPETAQGIYVNFLNVMSASRQKIPFGIAQIGKAFRNEINTKNFLFRTREFEQMEMQFFVKPGEDEKWFEYWRSERLQWFLNLGMVREKLRFQRHEGKHLAHYAKDAYDIEFEFPFGFGEIEGIHNRTDYDLSRHQKYSGKNLTYFDEESKERYTPNIIETSAGASRSLMAFLVNAYVEEEAPTAEGKMEVRTVLRLHPSLAPIKAAFFPLVNRDGMPEIARKIEQDIRPKFKVFYDDSGAVGRRYRRQDEAGTPFCFTIDSQTLQDQTVTVRDRDSMKQERINVDKILSYLQEQFR